MAGPYFAGQKAAQCGCYYPDVTRVRDDCVNHTRTYYCVVHGEITRPLDERSEANPDVCQIPPETWREKERERLRAVKDIH